MKYIYKIAVMSLCLIITALFTSACGSGSKSTAQNNSSLYYLLAQQENNNQQEQQNNNNGEDPVANNGITLALTDSKDSDKIAKADIYYKVESTSKTAEETEDQAILKAEPNANDNTKFTIPVNEKPENVKIKAILTYDSEGNLLDYFSSANGVISENGNFNVDFENSKDVDGFGGGSGTEDDPYIISAPRHFMNINKMFISNDILTDMKTAKMLDNEMISEIKSKGEISQNENGIYISQDDIPDETLDLILAYYSSVGTNSPYLYLDKHFKQTEDLDFTHLIGFKVNKADDDKEITCKVTTEKAPFYNEGNGITKIGEDNDDSCLKGTYDGDKHIIDGIIFVNPKIANISIFGHVNNSTIKNLTIGENSIVLIDENNEIFKENVLNINLISSKLNKSVLENCTNNAKIIVKNIETKYIIIFGLANSTDDCEFKNCTSNGNILLDNCNISNSCEIYGINYRSNNCENCTNERNINIDNCNIINSVYLFGINSFSKKHENCINEGYIKVTNNSLNSINIAGLAYQSNNITNCTNKGYIEITENKIHQTLQVLGIAIAIKDGTNCTNDGHINITNNKPLSTNSYNCIYIAGIADNTNSMTGCINNGNITYNNNTLRESYKFINGLNVQMNYGTITDCKNKGIITIDGVVQP